LRQIDRLAQMLAGTRPGGTTPLAESIMAAGRTVDSSLRVLEEQGQTAFLVILTDGVPTPSDRCALPHPLTSHCETHTHTPTHMHAR
jgi:Mg-chelatase subunit ChlD